MLKPDLLHDLSAQLGALLNSANVLVDSVGPSDLALGSNLNVESGELHRVIRDVEIGIRQEAPLEVVGSPSDHAGPAQLVAEMLNKAQHHFGARLGNPKANFQFFNPVFQVSPFPSVRGVTSPVHHVLTGKGRPASPAQPGEVATA